MAATVQQINGIVYINGKQVECKPGETTTFTADGNTYTVKKGNDGSSSCVSQTGGCIVTSIGNSKLDSTIGKISSDVRGRSKSKCRQTPVISDGKTFISDKLYVIGNNNHFIGDYCNVFGDNNFFSGDHCTVTGNNNSLAGGYCKAVGNNNTFSGNHCIGNGNDLRSTGNYCIMTGLRCIVSGDHSFHIFECDKPQNSLGYVSPPVCVVPSAHHRISDRSASPPPTRTKDIISGVLLTEIYDESGKQMDDTLTDVKRLECPVCIHNEKRFCFQECGHAVCVSCARKLIDNHIQAPIRCPQCRTVITKKMLKLFL